MATSASAAPLSSAETPIIVKIAIDGANRKFKFPLKDMSINVFPDKMRELLQIPSNQRLQMERFSDSSASFLALDIANPSSYKQLARAAKAKGKIRMRGAAVDEPKETEVKQEELPRYTALPTLANILNPTTQETLPTRPKVEVKPEADVKSTPAFRTATSRYFDELASMHRDSQPAINQKPAPTPVRTATLTPSARTCWQVCCNSCDASMSDVHYHCSTCDGGDYDLCEGCVKKGIYCLGQGHWLIKRFIKNGQVINSTTEKVAPRLRTRTAPPHSAYFWNASTAAVTANTEETVAVPNRTCNACVRVLPEHLFVHCMSCPDFDLCLSCQTDNTHGHHPEHEFKALSKDTPICSSASKLCQPGRNVRHWAICDSCDKSIFGIRHKCLDCPDFDLCNDCSGQGRVDHPHRFVKCYEPLAPRIETKARHYGIYCDGPLCNSGIKQGYIHGIRYKCAICHDTDFCERCEAHPSNKHNASHPLIKFKTMIQGVKISTMDTTANGQTATLGDKDAPESSASASSNTLPQHTPDTANKVSIEQGIAVMKALHDNVAATCNKSKTEAVKPEVTVAQKQNEEITQSAAELSAHFKHDTVSDGTRFDPRQVFEQTWTLYNPGPRSWPAGCSVRHIGGDYMLNVDQTKPSSVLELLVAQETNVTQEEVPAHGTASFAVTLKTPARPGRHISYWRLKTNDGLPFGHKLWCDIQVSAPTTGDANKEEQQRRLQYLQAMRKANQEQLAKAYRERMMRDLAEKNGRSVLNCENKARYQTMREEQQTLYEHFTRLAPQKQEAESNSVTSEVKEEPVAINKATEEATIKPEESDQSKMTESAMVFPKLDKESPAASTHEDTSLVDAASVSQNDKTVAVTSAKEAEKENDSVAFSDSEEDDGFFTDEEYDILDASDEEIIQSKASTS